LKSELSLNPSLNPFPLRDFPHEGKEKGKEFFEGLLGSAKNDEL